MISPRLLRYLAASFGLAATVFAAETPTGSQSTSEPPKGYTDQGSTTTRVDTTYSNINDFPSPGFSSRGANFGSTSSTVIAYHQVLVAPPVPPPLGEPIPQIARRTVAKFSPTSTLAEFVYEPFFTPLSPLLFSEDLSRGRREKLDGFRSRRTAALATLHAKLDSLQGVSAEARQTALADFAREQTPALADLERSAEEMRVNYVDGSFFQSGSDWNETRNWRLGDNTRWESNLDEIKVMLGAAYFQEGLSPAQRRLLRELAMELNDSVSAPLAEISLGTPGPFIYFSPEMARIRVPAELSPALARTLQTYQSEKAALKQELRALLYKQDRAFWEFRRTAAVKALAEQQAARLANLEQLAEQIRAGLAPLPNPAKPPTVILPRELMVRANQYRDTKETWQHEMMTRLETLRAAFPEDRVEFVRQKDSVVIQLVGNRRSSPDLAARRDAAQAELSGFNEVHAATYAAIAREKAALSGDIVKAASSLAGRTNNIKTIEMLLAEFNYAFSLQERWERYADYETAVLQPGLSPEQRRLLFGAAVESLDLPFGGSF